MTLDPNKPIHWPTLIVAALAWLVLFLLATYALTGCATLTPDSVKAMANIEARAVVKAEVTGVESRINSSDIKLRDLTAEVVQLGDRVNNTNSANVFATWLAIGCPFVLGGFYIWVWRPVRHYREKKRNGGT